jgi:prolyl oligopeptidase
MTGVLLPALLSAQSARLPYPSTKKVDQVDDYFGVKVADPYRWLEDPNSAETQAWVDAQNRLTNAFLERITARAPIEKRLTELWNYERYGLPSRQGPYYVYSRNDGLQNQAVLYRAEGLDGKAETLLDPNTLSTDGTAALANMAFSDDGSKLAYAISASGSDWMEWRVREVKTARDLPDLIKWSKFSGAAWTKDGAGFYYSRFDAPKEGEAYQGVNKNQKVYFHRVGTAQDADELIYARPDHPDWGLNADITEDGRFLFIYQSEGTNRENRIFLKDLSDPASTIAPLLDAFDASYTIVGNDGDRFYVLTDKDAPRNRLIAIDRRAPAPAGWKTLIPEAQGTAVLSSVAMNGDRFLAVWRVDAHEQVKVYDLAGTLVLNITLPSVGTVGGFSGRRRDPTMFYAFTSFTYPTTVYGFDAKSGESHAFRRPRVPFDSAAFETTQRFYTSKDGTRVPMFIVHKKGLTRNGRNPTYLYGYGGFDISLTPAFSPANIAWMEMGGVYAQANLRGGGEYGKAWHDGGRLKNKQNVFDDFIAAAEFLIAEKYTSTPKLAIGGGSNGGLLVGAAITQRPDLFGAAVPAVGVLDMLRFHKFTIGWAWTSDYGSAETKEGFDVLIKYSPLHNVKPGAKYPATMVVTADHDDRVVPAHSHKFTATLQAAQGGDAPILARIETKAGHGAGKPTSKLIEERADIWAFLHQVLAIDQ